VQSVVFLNFLLLCWVEIHSVLTKVLIMFQIYHTWIYPLYCSLSFLLPDSWNSFNRYHFCIYKRVHSICTIFILLSLYTSLIPPQDMKYLVTKEKTLVKHKNIHENIFSLVIKFMQIKSRKRLYCTCLKLIQHLFWWVVIKYEALS
jgi:hypothetical protein